MFRRIGIAAPLILGVLSAGCATTSQRSPAPILAEYAGVYTRGSDGSWLRLCSASPGDRLWVTFIGSAADDARGRTDAGLLLAAPTFVRWRAERVIDGRVGPGGPALLVHQILEARSAVEGGCRGKAAPGGVVPPQPNGSSGHPKRRRDPLVFINHTVYEK